MTSDRAAVVRANETSIVWGRSSSRKLWAVRNSRRRRDARFFTRQLVEQAGRHRAAGGVLPNDYGKQYFHIEHPAPVSASVMTGMERVHVGRMNDRPSHPRTRPARAPGCGRGAPDLLVGSCRAQAPGRHQAVGYDPPQAPAAALAVLRRSRPTATMHDRTRSPLRRYRTTGERVVATGPPPAPACAPPPSGPAATSTYTVRQRSAEQRTGRSRGRRRRRPQR